MASLDRSGHLRLAPMGIFDLDAVLAVEERAYAVPWTRGNFVDSLAAGHLAFSLFGSGRELLGYFVAMQGFEELHLLNLTIDAHRQGQGLGALLLSAVESLARERQAREVLLEVRLSNARAQALYLRRGFLPVGMRRAYYPMPAAIGGREDATVMSLKLVSGAHLEAGDGLE